MRKMPLAQLPDLESNLLDFERVSVMRVTNARFMQ